MKKILLTTTAIVAFAGAAAAEVSFSGAASGEYNSVGGFNTDADLDAKMSAELDNGYSVSTTLSFDTENYGGNAIASGSLTLSSDTVSLTFGDDITSASFSAVGDTIGFGDGEDGIQGAIGSVTMGAATLFVSTRVAAAATTVQSSDLEFGVTAAVGDMTVGFGVADTNFVGKASGTAAGLSYTVAAGSVDDATRWDVAVSYPAGPVTVGFTVDDSEAWEASAAYAADGLSAEVTYASASETFDVEGSYDMGNGVVMNAGYLGETEEMYIGGSYALGGGASAYASYVNSDSTEAGAEIGAQDYAPGTTVGLSFAF